MREKIYVERTSKESGVSHFVFQNKYGKFSGIAQFSDEENPEDFSRFVGIRYAEIRARLEFVKLRLKQEKIKLRTIKELKKDIEHNITTPDISIMRRVNLKLRDYSQSVSDWENLYNHLRVTIKHQDKTRQEILSRSKKDN